MDRVCEPELMNEEEQSVAYSNADFELSHQAIADDFRKWVGPVCSGASFLDLGCGPGDVSMRLLSFLPAVEFHGVDGAPRMLRLFEERLRLTECEGRVRLFEGLIGQVELPCRPYNFVFSSSLLHHLHDPLVLWRAISASGGVGTKVFVADLIRPDSVEEVQNLLDEYAGSEPELLQQDFRASMYAAFRVDEVELQLQEAGLGDRLSISLLGERHMVIRGDL